MKSASHERTNTMRVHVHEMSRTGTSMEKERRLVVSWGWGNRRYGVWLLEGMRFLWGGDENVLELTVVMVVHLCGYTKKPMNCTL